MNLVRSERLSGMMPADYLKWFAEQAAKHDRIVEVGCFRGRTTTALCDNTCGMVTAVDTWQGAPGLMEYIQFMQKITGNPDWLFDEFMHNMADFNNLEICRMPSTEAAAFFRSRGRNFDMIFIDGLHDYENIRADILAWAPLLSVGGLMCGHDYQFPDVNRAVNELFPSIAGPGNSDMWLIQTGVPVEA
jgi:O-antigen biosynthesis protein